MSHATFVGLIFGFQHVIAATQEIFPPLFTIDRISQRNFVDGTMLHVAISGSDLQTIVQWESDFPPLEGTSQCAIALGVLVNDNLADSALVVPWELLVERGEYEDELLVPGVGGGLTSVSLVILHFFEIQIQLWHIFPPVEIWVGPAHDHHDACVGNPDPGIPVSGGCYPPFLSPHRQPKLDIVVDGLLSSPLRWSGFPGVEKVALQTSWIPNSCENAHVVVWMDRTVVKNASFSAEGFQKERLFVALDVDLEPRQLSSGTHLLHVQLLAHGHHLEETLHFEVPPPHPSPRAATKEWTFPGCSPSNRNSTQCLYWAEQLVRAAGRDASMLGGSAPPESAVFVHIPRTGTKFMTLLRNLLPACYTHHFACSDLPPEQRKAALSAELRDCGGHLIGCGPDVMHLTAMEVSRRYPQHAKVTMVRDPVARELSSFFFHQAANHDASRFSDEEVMAFVVEQDAACRLGQSTCLEQHGRNMQTTLLGAGYSAHAQAGERVLHLRVRSKELEMAKAALSSMLFFGVTDRWEETVCVFHCELGGLPHPSELENNIHPTAARRRHLSPALRAFFARRNALDMLLFEFATKFFDNRVHRCVCAMSG